MKDLLLAVCAVFVIFGVLIFKTSEKITSTTGMIKSYISVSVVAVVPLVLGNANAQPCIRIVTVRHPNGNKGTVLLVTNENVAVGDKVNVYALQGKDLNSGKSTTTFIATKSP